MSLLQLFIYTLLIVDNVEAFEVIILSTCYFANGCDDCF